MFLCILLSLSFEFILLGGIDLILDYRGGNCRRNVMFGGIS